MRPSRPYRWAAPGDVNAFFGLMLDNVMNLVILAGILISVFKMPSDVVYTRMFPGTAFGVLFGDLVYTWMAFRLAKREGRDNVTAMPLGLDAPSTIGMAFTVLGPAFVAATAAAARARSGDPGLANRHGLHGAHRHLQAGHGVSRRHDSADRAGGRPARIAGRRRNRADGLPAARRHPRRAGRRDGVARTDLLRAHCAHPAAVPRAGRAGVGRGRRGRVLRPRIRGLARASAGGRHT